MPALIPVLMQGWVRPSRSMAITRLRRWRRPRSGRAAHDSSAAASPSRPDSCPCRLGRQCRPRSTAGSLVRATRSRRWPSSHFRGMSSPATSIGRPAARPTRHRGLACSVPTVTGRMDASSTCRPMPSARRSRREPNGSRTAPGARCRRGASASCGWGAWSSTTTWSASPIRSSAWVTGMGPLPTSTVASQAPGASAASRPRPACRTGLVCRPSTVFGPSTCSRLCPTSMPSVLP